MKVLIPENELWLHTPKVKARLERALEWAEKNPPKASDLDQLAAKLKRRIIKAEPKNTR